MIKVLILAKYLLSGGAEKVLRDIYSEMPTDINAKIVFVYNIHTEENERKRINHSCLKISEKYLHMGAIGTAIAEIITIVKYTLTLIREKPDITIGFGDFEVICNQIAGTLAHTKQIQSYRNNVHFPRAGKITKILNKYLFIPLTGLTASKIIVNSEDNRTLLINEFGVNENKILTIYNPTDIKKIDSLALKTDENISIPFEKSKTIITVGRCVPEKGHKYLIRIFSEIINEIDAKLIICGDGPLYSELKNLVADYHLENDIYLLGWCNNPYQYMKHATVFALPSLFEGLPNALIEAMVCGCPIVSADCDFGPREILKNGEYGYLSKPLGPLPNNLMDKLSDEELDMKNKLMLILTDDECQKKYSNLSRQVGLTFAKEKLLEKYYDTIRDIAH